MAAVVTISNGAIVKAGGIKKHITSVADVPEKPSSCSSHNYKWGLEHDEPHLFAIAQSAVRHRIQHCILYFLLRVIAAVYFVVWLILIIKRDLTPFWLINESNWALVFFNLHLIVQAWIVTHFYFSHGTSINEGRMTWILKTSWVLHNISFATSVITTLVYWFMIYTDNPDENVIDVYNVHLHIVPVSFGLLDLFISAMPIRVLHFYQPLLVTAVYVTFHGLFTAYGPRSELLYELFEWNGPWEMTALRVSFAILACLLVWLIITVLSRLVIVFYQCIYQSCCTATADSVYPSERPYVYTLRDY